MRIDVSKIKAALAELGMTQAALADVSGVSRQSISTILNRGTCSLIVSGKIAKALGVPVAEIMKED